jgi:2-polyprenyl-3-methyl-5-hydroxy-6-metoxy-1,4-benzoquinol methylase
MLPTDIGAYAGSHHRDEESVTLVSRERQAGQPTLHSKEQSDGKRTRPRYGQTPVLRLQGRRCGAVADVGCGNGQALIILAQAYPEATFVGYDNYAPAIAAANAHARQAGLGDRLRFEVCDVTQGIPGQYDLITTFDVVHDMPRPRPALKEIKRALNPGGTYFVLEFNFYGELQANIDHPLGIGAFGYSASTNYCMTQALAVGGEGTGTCMGEEKMRELADEAGFGQFRRMDFANNPFNIFYEIRV